MQSAILSESHYLPDRSYPAPFTLRKPHKSPCNILVAEIFISCKAANVPDLTVYSTLAIIQLNGSVEILQGSLRSTISLGYKYTVEECV